MPGATGRFQCPQCGALWNPNRNDVSERLNLYKSKHARLLKKREQLINSNMSTTSYEYRLQVSELKTELLVCEHTISCLRAELMGQPVQMWQMRYQSAMDIAKEFMSINQYDEFKRRLDEACRPKVK